MRVAARLAVMSSVQRWEQHEHAWAAFAAAPPDEMCERDIPFPDLDALRGANAGDAKPVVGACRVRGCSTRARLWLVSSLG
jgi:hypothetical protein